MPDPGLSGLGGAPVRTVPVGPVTAWVSDVADDVLREPNADLVRAHDAVVRAAMESETPLPARFGQTFFDDAALRGALTGRSAGLARGLQRVRGAVEMTVRALLEGPAAPARPRASGDVPPGTSGRQYLEWLRGREQAAEARRRQADFLHARVARAVGELVRAEARASAPASTQTLTISHLVPRDAVAQYRGALGAFVEREPHLRLLVSGPWAPYSFAEPPDA